MLNLSNSLGQCADKILQTDHGIRNCANTYLVQKNTPAAICIAQQQQSTRQRESERTDRTKNRLKQVAGQSQNTKRRPRTQPGLLLMGALGLGKSKNNRSSSRQHIYFTENNQSGAAGRAEPLSSAGDTTNLSKRHRKGEKHT